MRKWKIANGCYKRRMRKRKNANGCYNRRVRKHKRPLGATNWTDGWCNPPVPALVRYSRWCNLLVSACIYKDGWCNQLLFACICKDGWRNQLLCESIYWTRWRKWGVLVAISIVRRCNLSVFGCIVLLGGWEIVGGKKPCSQLYFSPYLPNSNFPSFTLHIRSFIFTLLLSLQHLWVELHKRVEKY